MKKFGLLLAGGIAAFILLSTIGPMVGLLVSVVLLYFIFKQFLKTKSIGGRIGLGIIGFIVLIASLHNVPAIIGIAAAYVLYLVYKKWNKSKVNKTIEADDPFSNFEKQWSELKQY
ncbi:flagellar basal body rod protein [Bacillus sp. AFS076308]|uniref:lmo0954 family membrane protein n=1 Tax=unclassified Bacillus (in: firmicutes) TaxID=185979 RepID=UPI000BF9DD3E|nr:MULTISPECIES: flagellar basal body rod protein [unclassified Bacillus (in: firmicutes)]PFO09025.1 flagellar basal body rod protein [Bacillus sp. AFS076308]PGV52599.1 flagellar basal body rod protein [Bacillus sp. AFS037270]